MKPQVVLCFAVIGPAFAQHGSTIPFAYIQGLSDQDRITLAVFVIIFSLVASVAFIRFVGQLLGCWPAGSCVPDSVRMYVSNAVAPVEGQGSLFLAPETAPAVDAPAPIEIGEFADMADRVREHKAATDRVKAGKMGMAVKADKSTAAKVRAKLENRDAGPDSNADGEDGSDLGRPTIAVASKSQHGSVHPSPSLAHGPTPTHSAKGSPLNTPAGSRRPSLAAALGTPGHSRRPSLATDRIELPMPLTSPAKTPAGAWTGLETARSRTNTNGRTKTADWNVIDKGPGTARSRATSLASPSTARAIPVEPLPTPGAHARPDPLGGDAVIHVPSIATARRASHLG